MRLGDLADVGRISRAQADVVTANPPYIPLGRSSRWPPRLRDLDPPSRCGRVDDGLDAIRVVDVGRGGSARRRALACEHADVQGEAAPAVFAASGQWSTVRDHRDLAGRSRFVTARRVPRDEPRGWHDKPVTAIFSSTTQSSAHGGLDAARQD